MNADERYEVNALHSLPDHTQRLLKAFFKIRRIGVNTRISYIKAAKSYIQTVGKPLQEACNQNLTKWYISLNDRLAAGTIFLYAVSLRNIYAYALQQRGLEKDEAKREAEKSFRTIPFRQLQKEADKKNGLRDKLISQEEFQRLLNVTDHPRLRAFIVASAEAGTRPEELTATRIRDLEFNKRYAQIRVNGKTGERTIPLIRSIPYLKAWLQVHPDRKNSDAPLFAVVYKGEMRFPNRGTVERRLWRLRKKAGIKRRIYPYMLRHTRLTDLAARGIGEYQLKSFAGWTQDSKMASKYVHLTGRTALKVVLEIEGVAQTEREKRPELIKTKTCPRCGSVNEIDAVFCNRCSLTLDEKTLHERRKTEEETDTIMDMLVQHPKVREAIKSAAKELWTQGKI